MTTRVGVRHRNGTIKHYDVSGTNTPEEARAFVLSQVPTARTVMALVIGGDRRVAPVAVTPTAA